MKTRRFLAPLVTAIALVAAALVVPAGTAQAAITQGIAGTVTKQGGGPVSFGTVTVVPVVGAQVGQATNYQTGADGKFEISLAPGNYWVRFASDDLGWAPEWYEDGPSEDWASLVGVESGAVHTVNVELVPAATISGTIAQAQGAGDGHVEAWQFDSLAPNGWVLAGTASTDMNGGFEVRGLPGGAYALHLTTTSNALEGWWQGKPTRDRSTRVHLSSGESATGIEPVLTSYGDLAGKVTRSSNSSGVQGVEVHLYQQTTPGTWTDVADLSTGATGTFAGHVPTGTYRLQFEPTSGDVAGEFWNDAATVESAQDVIISAGATTTTNATLAATPTSLTNSVPPTITGTPKVGQKLMASDGSWQPVTVMIATFQWKRNGTPITGATASTYTVSPADAGKRLTVTVTEHTQHLGSPSATSSAVTVPLQTLKLTSAASLTGTLKVGKTLRATPPRSTPVASVKYQWLRNGVAIRGATGATHKLVRADKGKRIGVRIVLSRPGYATVTKTLTKSTKVK